MTNWQYLLLCAAALCLILARLMIAINRRKDQKNRERTRKLETLLQPRETIKVICPQKRSRCILTSHRLIFEKKGRFTAFLLTTITKVQGQNQNGNRTTVPGNMVKLVITADREYLIFNTCPEFAELAAQLTDKVKKQKEKKKASAKKA